MPFLVMLAIALAAGCAVAAVAWRAGRRPAQEAASQAAASAPEGGPDDPAARTGMALGAAGVAVAAGAIVVGVLTLAVRGQAAPRAFDRGAADWAHEHAVGWSTTALDAVTRVGAPWTASAIAAAFTIVMAIRTRNRWLVPFMLVAVGGTSLLTTALKEAIDRIRPSLNPIAETLGPSFPSGHSSHAAAAFAAMALVLGRDASRRTRALLAGAAAGLAVAVAATRVLLDVHWLSDVVAGLALGWTWFAVSAVAFRGRRLEPAFTLRAARRRRGTRPRPARAGARPR